ncbi:MAG TPA: ATP-binding protein, partial [Syntrophales bacterium]|nr:ATP-binding protein [Syntrophales bacterium]
KNSANKLIAVIVVALDLDYLQNIFDKFNLAPGSSFSLLDQRGIILYRNIKDDLSKTLIRNRDIQEDLFSKMRDGSDEGTFEAIGNDGKPRLLAYKKISLPKESKPYLYIRSSIPLASATSHAYAVIFKSLTAFMLLFLVGLFLAWLIGNRMIVNPIMALKTASGKLAAGTSIVNVSYDVKGGELGELARTFDGMAEALVQRETDRNAAEEALQTALQRLRTFVANMHSSLLLVGDEGRVILANQAFCDYFELQETPADLVGTTTNEMIDKVRNAYLHPGEEITRIREILRRGEAVIGEEITMHDGRTCLRDFIPIYADGKSYGRLWHQVDITERKRAEDVLKERTAQLEAANKELESFSYTVSHDLRAPLRAIDGYARIILKKQGDKFDEDTLRQFNDIRSNSQMMGKLIDDLLAFSRLSRKDMSKSQLNMVDLIGEEWKRLNDINPDRKMNLIVNNTPFGYGDAALIKRVYHNLLSNAVKFTKLRDEAIIEVGGYNDGNEDVFYVKDNGIGFDMKYYDKLFGVFQRLHNNPDFEGTGVGLATVQRIVHRQGGRVWAEGKVNEGATFYFTLPHNADRLIL